MQNIDEIKNILGPLLVLENEPLSKHTYFKIGGPAKLFFSAKNVNAFKLALETAHHFQIPFLVLGQGANVLISDKGFDGLVIKNAAEEVKLVGIKGTIDKTGKGIKNALIWSASGTLMNRLARFTLDQGLEGLEFLLSIPGTVGGGLKINAHFAVSKGELIGSKVVSAVLFDPKTASIRTVDNKYFEFSYDYSKIQQTQEIILEVIFRLDKAKDPQSLWQKAMDNVKARNESQPIGIPSSGCIFKNIKNEDAKRLTTPNLTTSAGYIIESLGFKGQKVGGAQISKDHANFILNTGGATASDVLKLVKLIKEKAKDKYKLNLEEEIFYIGDFRNNIWESQYFECK